VIDDAHELEQSSPSARLIEALCRHAPPRLHLVIAGRRQPPFQIERLRGQGQLLEIDGVSSRSPLWRWRSWWRIGSASTPSSWPRKFTASPVGGRRP